jgi:hypothetical protein
VTPEEIEKRFAKLSTAAEARNLAANARRLGQPELAEQTHLRGLDLRAREEGYNSPAARAIAVAIYLYEQEQTRVLRRKCHANRTRKMLRKPGPLHPAERMVLNPRPSKAYRELEDIDRMDLSYEAIVVRFPDEFDAPAPKSSSSRRNSSSPRVRLRWTAATVRPLPPLERPLSAAARPTGTPGPAC